MSNVAFATDRFRGGNSSGSSRMDNKKQGHFALFRSVLTTDWAKDIAKLALWVRLLGEATYRPRSVEFAGREWFLQPGQLVTTPAIMARKLRDQDNSEKSAQAVTRMLKFFTKEGMISTAGSPFGTVITITNYARYQGVLGNEPSDNPTDKPQASNGAGLKVVADNPTDEPSDKQNKKVVNNKVLKDTQTHDVGLLDEKKLTPRQKGTNPRAKGTNPRAALPAFDRDRLKSTWNCKAKQFGLPTIRSITTTTENGLKRLWASYLKQCEELGADPKDIDSFLNGYLEFGYRPTEWACGANPSGTKYGISTALTQEKIDQILGQEA